MIKKICKTCKEEKDITEFGKHKKCRLGVRNECKKCHSKRTMDYQKQNKNQRDEYVKKWRSQNKDKIKSQQDNYKDTKNESRRKRYAEDDEYREKAKIRSRQWQESNPIKKKAQRLKSKYNIDYEDYIKMLEKADYKCEICGYSDLSNAQIFPFIDHCHKTGKIRGILCSDCNFGIGKFKDNTKLLENAIKYLEEV